jgi:membrane protein required for beta-lactamase induction
MNQFNKSMTTAKEHLEGRLKFNQERLDETRAQIHRITSGQNWVPSDVAGIAMGAIGHAENIHTLQTLLHYYEGGAK